MSFGDGRTPAMGIAAVLITLLFAGCRKPPAQPAMPPAAVTVARPIEREVQEWDEYPGRLEAKETVEVRARVTGYITSVSFKEGGTVNAGDLLFVIDPRPYEAELARAQGEVARAQAQVALAETQFKRTAGLVPTQAASELELDERRAERDEAKAALSVAQANVDAARLNVDFTKVRAPISGRISRIYVTPGNLVSSGGGSGAGGTGGSGGGAGQTSLLTTITSLDPIYCYVDADERSVLKYQRLVREKKRPDARGGAQVPARLALLNEDVFLHEGVIDFVDNRIDPTTGTLRARGVFANPDGVMTPGLFGRLRVPGSEPYRTLLVPEQAVQTDQNSKYVLTVDAENTVRVTPVTVGSQFGTLRSVTKGLSGDERVVINGLLRARPGGKVNPEEGPMPGADSPSLSTTRIVEPDAAAAGPTTHPAGPATTRPATTAPARGSSSSSSSAAAAPDRGPVPLTLGVAGGGEVRR